MRTSGDRIWRLNFPPLISFCQVGLPEGVASCIPRGWMGNLQQPRRIPRTLSDPVGEVWPTDLKHQNQGRFWLVGLRWCWDRNRNPPIARLKYQRACLSNCTSAQPHHTTLTRRLRSIKKLLDWQGETSCLAALSQIGGRWLPMSSATWNGWLGATRLCTKKHVSVPCPYISKPQKPRRDAPYICIYVYWLRFTSSNDRIESLKAIVMCKLSYIYSCVQGENQQTWVTMGAPKKGQMAAGILRQHGPA